MIGIIGAMDTEVDNIKAQVKGKTVSFIAGVEFVCGFIEDVTVCVAKCSPGKVNAAICTQAMIDNFDKFCQNLNFKCLYKKKFVPMHFQYLSTAILSIYQDSFIQFSDFLAQKIRFYWQL